MADSKQLDVLKHLTAHLEGITPANGYAHDLRGRVFRGRAVFGESDPVPMISILEAPRPNDGAPAGEEWLVRQEDWVLLLQGWAEDDRKNPSDPVYQIKAEVELRLSEIVKTKNGVGVSPAFRLGGRITSLSIGPGLVRPADQISSRAYFLLPLVVGFTSDVGQPFVEA